MTLSLNLEAARNKAAYVHANGWIGRATQMVEEITAAGFTVATAQNTATHFEVVTECGLVVSSSGYAHPKR